MYITHNINDFDIDNIFFNKSVNNTVINNGKFSRVIYSNSLYTINSLLYVVKLSNITFGRHRPSTELYGYAPLAYETKGA